MKISLPITLGLGLAAASLASAQVTILSQNFDSTATQTVTGGSSLVIGSGTSALSLSTATGTTVEVIDTGSGNNALRYTDNQSGGNTPNAVSNTFTGVSTNTTGNNYIVGSFDFKILSVSSGSAPSFGFQINANSQTNSSSNSSVLIYFNNNGGSATNVSYVQGLTATTTQTVSATTLTANINYRLSLIADYSNTGSTNLDSYTFKIIDLDDNSTTVYASSSIATRANADLTPNRIVFYGGASGTAFNADPFFQIDNINFTATNASAIPEPTTAALLAGLACLVVPVVRRRSRR